MAKRQAPDTRPEIYVSTDIEADGPIPGPHSMLSFASAAMLADKTVVGTFSANLETLPGAVGHPVQMQWWETQPEAWTACRRDLQRPEAAMVRYVEWVESLPGKPVFVAFPAGFDFTWMFWYMMRFVGRSPFGWAALDVKTLGFALTGLPYRKAVKPAFPAAWKNAPISSRMWFWVSAAAPAWTWPNAWRCCCSMAGLCATIMARTKSLAPSRR